MNSLMISRRGRRGREAGGKTINDFLNDFPPARDSGGKIINDFLNDFPPGLAGEGGRRKLII